MRNVAFFVVVVLFLGLGLRWACQDPAPPRLRLVTFNIEGYPKSARQEAGAFAVLRELDAPTIAVQEIMEPARFAEAARRRLGEHWRFVWALGSGPHHVGLLYDEKHLELDWVRERRETAVDDRTRSTLEARLRPRSGPALRIFVAHLRAGADGVEVRRRQLAALAPLLREARRSGDRVLLLGDLNSTGPEDRQGIAELARLTDLEWASRNLPCTSFWDRRQDEGDCVGSALDHALTSEPPRAIEAHGPCRDGCESRSTCPRFHLEVSDHCPVSLELR